MTQNGNGMKPKVELNLGQETRLKLIRDKAYVGQNSYGQYYLYGVTENGEEKSFFASEDIHAKILEAGLHSGDEFSIKKVPQQQGRRVVGIVEFAVLSKQPAPPLNGNGGSDHFKALMKACVAEAVEITKEVNTIPWQNEDVRSIALTMFIQRARLN